MSTGARSGPARVAPLYLLRIEVDGHFNGSADVPKPWVARISAPCPRYGLQREFIRPMNDWRDAHRAWSGNLYGMVATFPLREGSLYEVARLRGRSSKRYMAREFYWIEGKRMHRRTPEETLALAEGDAGGKAVILRVREDVETSPFIAEVTGLGTPTRLGFILVDDHRHYRLREDRLYEIVGVVPGMPRDTRFATVDSGDARPLSEREALEWLRTR